MAKKSISAKPGKSAPKSAKKTSTKKAAPKSSKGKVSAQVETKAPAASTDATSRGAGRPSGATNFVPSSPLQVRDSGNFKGVFEGPVGPRWVRIYAADQENSLRLAALVSLIEKGDASLTRLLQKEVKANAAG